jgi:hypothetical protein
VDLTVRDGANLAQVLGENDFGSQGPKLIWIHPDDWPPRGPERSDLGIDFYSRA